jgi:glycerol-3-phosphate O-acyltransferase/dihydroxyacetone phosphate acyltransferase
MPEAPSPAAVHLARSLVAIFFQRIDVLGAERVPAEGPVVFVANHHNSLVDPALLLARLPRKPRFLAKSTLWKVPVTRRLLDLAAAIPVYRRQDAGEDTSRNLETFAACHEVLAAGGAVALFPEGVSHDAPRLAPLKTGAARIVLGAEAERGPLGVHIVPVGLTFDQKSVFRSRVLLHVGEPLDPAPFVADAERDARAAARALTDEIETRLRAVTLNYPSEEDVPLVERASEVLATPEKQLPARLALTEAFALRTGVLDAWQRLGEHYPREALAVRSRAERYAAALTRLGLRDDHVASRYPGESVLLYALGSGSLLLFWLPLAAIGTLLNWVPYRLCGVLARLTRSEDLPATYKLLGGFVLFPLTWAAEAALAARAFGASGFLWLLLLAPLTAWFAMRFHERYERFFDEAAAWLRLRLRRRDAAALRAEREALRDELHRLRDLDRRSPGGP